MTAPFQQQNQTVLGVSIKSNTVGSAECNSFNENFGYPMTVGTRASD